MGLLHGGLQLEDVVANLLRRLRLGRLLKREQTLVLPAAPGLHLLEVESRLLQALARQGMVVQAPAIILVYPCDVPIFA